MKQKIDTGTPFSEDERYILASYFKGVWWYADDADNPFGVALLVCPSGKRRVDLYTRESALILMKSGKKNPSLLFATPNLNKMLNKFGWKISREGKTLSVSLPSRFTSSAAKILFLEYEMRRSSLLEAKKHLDVFCGKQRRSVALKKSRAEFQEQLENRKGGEK